MYVQSSFRILEYREYNKSIICHRFANKNNYRKTININNY